MKKYILLLVSILFCVLLSMNCLAADDDESGGLIIFEKPVEGVVFEHKLHSDLDCSDCHDDIFPQEAGGTAEAKDFTMKAMEEGETCGSCHDGDTAFSVKKDCLKCHVGKMNIKKIEAEAGE
jgi:c(7)-type cytochrome triheme protein